MNPAILVDAAEVERLHPEMIDRPTFRELRDIQPGAVVKINVCQKFFWAKIFEEKDGILTGIVPVEIKLTRDHIFSIFKGDGAK